MLSDNFDLLLVRRVQLVIVVGFPGDDRLLIEVWTDGTMSPEEAVSYAAELFTHAGDAAIELLETADLFLQAFTITAKRLHAPRNSATNGVCGR